MIGKNIIKIKMTGSAMTSPCPWKTIEMLFIVELACIGRSDLNIIEEVYLIIFFISIETGAWHICIALEVPHQININGFFFRGFNFGGNRLFNFLFFWLRFSYLFLGISLISPIF